MFGRGTIYKCMYPAYDTLSKIPDCRNFLRHQLFFSIFAAERPCDFTLFYANFTPFYAFFTPFLHLLSLYALSRLVTPFAPCYALLHLLRPFTPFYASVASTAHVAGAGAARKSPPAPAAAIHKNTATFDGTASSRRSPSAVTKPRAVHRDDGDGGTDKSPPNNYPSPSASRTYRRPPRTRP